MEIKSYYIQISFEDLESDYSGEVTIAISNPEKTIFVDCDVKDVIDVLINDHEMNYKYDRENKKIIVNNAYDTNIELNIKFSNNISNSLNGIYHCGNENSRMISTDLEPKHAMSVFPCFDDPSMKATFTLRVSIPSGLNAISNTSIDTEVFINGKKEITFHQTPKMSTYLFYLGIGKMEERMTMYKGKEIVIAAPGQINGDPSFALKIATECLAFYESYFSIDYTLSKLHLIAVPDFAPGAMENWGAITFRNDLLLLDNKDDIDQKIGICETIAHEMAHQWFGNLVTLSQWGDLWLNESFATLIASKFVSSVHPELGGDRYFVEHNLFSSMLKDSLLSTHPIKANVKESEYEQIFDEISYGKGASILRMIEEAIGEENFRKAISKYLDEKKFENGTITDLWYYLNAFSSEIDIPELASNWVEKPGFPIIRIERSDGGKKVILKQERFLLNGKDQSAWIVPVFLTTEDGDRDILMKNKIEEVEINQIISINRNVYGYYLFDSNGSGLNKDLRTMKQLDLALEEMSKFLLLLKGEINLSDYLNFVSENSNSYSYPMFSIVPNHLLELFNISDGSFQMSTKFSNVLRKMLQTSFTVNDDPTVFYSRDSINTSLAIMDKTYSDMMGAKISKLEQSPVYEHTAIIIGASRSTLGFYKVLGYLKVTKNSNLYSKICYGIGYTTSVTKQLRILNMLAEGKIKAQETPAVLHSLILNHKSRKLIMRLFGVIVNAIRSKFKDSGAVSLFFEYSIPYLGLVSRDEINKKIQKYSSSDLEIGTKIGLEKLEVYEKMRSRMN
ncbi:M1 family metallopeptidase [Cuniculiplasma sp. SKW4]|uniref:M1 family metallopeptidase n=1 Tax=Cuniculiplasma sp. SKW4 TaxID=3400171 RepID=UPI003FD25234